MVFSRNLYLRNPLAVMQAHALDAGNIVAPPTRVAGVFRSRGFAQIADAVVQAVAVRVVDIGQGPAAMDEQPRESMSAVHPPVDRDVAIGGAIVRLDPACDGTSRPNDAAPAVRSVGAPGQNTGLWIVFQQFPHLGLRKFVAHAAPVSLLS